MLCLNGKLEIICDDGISQKTFTLTRPNKGILIPDGIWATQKYLMTLKPIPPKLRESADGAPPSVGISSHICIKYYP